MASYEETPGPAGKEVIRSLQKRAGEREPLPSSDDTGYAQAIAGGTVTASPIGNDPAVKPNYMPGKEPVAPFAADREADKSRDQDTPDININLAPE
jgi:hypothetical protein